MLKCPHLRVSAPVGSRPRTARPRPPKLPKVSAMPIPSAPLSRPDTVVRAGAPDRNGSSPVHSVSVVVPVYRGEETIAALVAELDRLTGPSTTAAGARFAVEEIILVHDNGPDRSDVVLQELERLLPTGARGLAEPQFRPGRGDDRRYGGGAGRLDRHDGRGRSARPRVTSRTSSTRRWPRARTWSIRSRPTPARTASCAISPRAAPKWSSRRCSRSRIRHASRASG